MKKKIINYYGIVPEVDIEESKNEVHGVCDLLCETFKRVVK